MRLIFTENTARTAPNTIVIIARINNMKPQFLSCMKGPELNTKIPNNPDFVRSPESNALDGAGAAVCAVGSQI